MTEEVTLADEGGHPYRVLIRPGNAKDRDGLVKLWGPMLNRGPEQWLDRDWPWEEFGIADLAFGAANPEWLMLADEIEADARGDGLGVLVTTTPVTAQEAGLTDATAASGALLWVEYIAIAPSLRRDCPQRDRRVPFLKGVGFRLMVAAIERSVAMGLVMKR